MIVVQYLLFIVSVTGYSLLIKRKFSISFYFIPSLSITIIAVLMYIAGLLNIMKLSVFCVYICGIILFAKLSYKSFNQNINTHKFLNILPFFIILFIFGYLLYYWHGAVYGGGDTLTHWGIIARTIYEKDQLPNFLCTEIGYKSYPPITACWIYYVLKAIGNGYSESYTLFAQGIWMLSCTITLFSLNKNRKLLYDGLIGIFCIYLLFFNEGLDGLKVDTILALVTGAAFTLILYAYYIQKNFNLLILLIPFLVAITLVKNSGIFFALLIVICYTATSEYTKKTTQNRYKTIGILISIPIFTLYLWQRHIVMVFDDPGNTRHSLSVDAMAEIFSVRTPDEIYSIVMAYCKKWFSWNGSCEWQILIGLMICAIILFLLAHGKDAEEFQKLYNMLDRILLFYFFYKILLLGMYLFNFPGKDAVTIVAYERYQGSYVIVMIFLLSAMLSVIFNSIEVNVWYRTSIFVTVLFMLFYIRTTDPRISDRIQRPDYNGGTKYRDLIYALNSSGQIYEDSKILLYSTGIFDYYAIQFATNNQQSESTNKIADIYEALGENPREYSGIIILNWDESILKCLFEYGYESSTKFIFLQ